MSIIISGSRDIGDQVVQLEWKSFVNGGYILRVKVFDPYLALIRELTNGNNFLKTARKGPTEIKFNINWREAPDNRTTDRIAFISDLHVFGTGEDAGFDFVAVDPPSWWLNGGNGNGKVYVGNIKKVIEQVVSEYAPGITPEVSETSDDKNGRWPMYRQDPKTFIQSMLDWSCSLTKKKTNWLVSSVDRKIVIKEQNEMLQNAIKPIASYKAGFMDDKNSVVDFDMLSNVFVSPVQNKLITQGISAVTGKFLDKETEKDKTEVRDDNTASKVNADIDQRFGFKKPDSDWATSIMSVPEHSGGEVGKPYEEYMDGRARNIYMNLLPMVMRARITVQGDFRFDDSSALGVSTIVINWRDFDSEQFFLAGKWLVYGWVHKISRGLQGGTFWLTDLYLYRIDYDASATKV